MAFSDEGHMKPLVCASVCEESLTPPSPHGHVQKSSHLHECYLSPTRHCPTYSMNPHPPFPPHRSQHSARRWCRLRCHLLGILPRSSFPCSPQASGLHYVFSLRAF